MNRHPCRRHLWLGDRCALCGITGDPHKHCFQDIHWACMFPEPLEWEQPRKAGR